MTTAEPGASAAGGLVGAELRDAWPLLDLEEKARASGCSRRAEAEDFFLGLDALAQAELLAGLPARRAPIWMRLLPPDDAADLLQEVPPEQRGACLALLDERAPQGGRGAARLRRGRRRRPDEPALRARAARHERRTRRSRYLRRQARERVETIYYVYVLDDAQHLLGVVSFRELFAAPPDQPVRDIMHTDVVRVRADLDQESVTPDHRRARPRGHARGRRRGPHEGHRHRRRHRRRGAGRGHRGHPEDRRHGGPRRAVPADRPARRWSASARRWLAVLFVGEMLTATAMGYFEDEIARAVVLALFIPLIISSGGNSGSQATTLVIRAMALGEVRLRDWWRVMRRELASGLLLGLILGVDRAGARPAVAAASAHTQHHLLLAADRRHQPGRGRALGHARRLDAAVPAAAPRLRPRQRVGAVRGDARRRDRARDLLQRRDAAPLGDAALARFRLTRREIAGKSSHAQHDRPYPCPDLPGVAGGGVHDRAPRRAAPVLAAETPAQTRAAILRALIEYDYVVVSEQPGEIVARYSKPERNMVVAIDYSNEIRVRYVSSENLDYEADEGVTVIHGGYNKRVDRLSKRIGTEVAIVRATSTLPPSRRRPRSRAEPSSGRFDRVDATSPDPVVDDVDHFETPLVEREDDAASSRVDPLAQVGLGAVENGSRPWPSGDRSARRDFQDLEHLVVLHSELDLGQRAVGRDADGLGFRRGGGGSGGAALPATVASTSAGSACGSTDEGSISTASGCGSATVGCGFAATGVLRPPAPAPARRRALHAARHALAGLSSGAPGRRSRTGLSLRAAPATCPPGRTAESPAPPPERLPIGGLMAQRGLLEIDRPGSRANPRAWRGRYAGGSARRSASQLVLGHRVRADPIPTPELESARKATSPGATAGVVQRISSAERSSRPSWRRSRRCR